MNLVKRILVVALLVIVILIGAVYFYFDRKFTPEPNYLQVRNESGRIQMTWENNTKDALLLPVKFDRDTATYYMQLDTGSPYTVFYKHSIVPFKNISITGNTAQAEFTIGDTRISSNRFKILDFGNALGKNDVHIIGTLGTDLLDQRKTEINFKENYVILNKHSLPENFQKASFDFNFKKRKIIISGALDDRKNKFLYDSGTSAYEFLTTKENWNALKLKNSKIVQEKGKSWNRILTTYTAETQKQIRLGNVELPLRNVTYVEGYSKMQYYLMKYSGMSGMLGNRIFMDQQIFIDAQAMKMAVY